MDVDKPAAGEIELNKESALTETDPRLVWPMCQQKARFLPRSTDGGRSIQNVRFSDMPELVGSMLVACNTDYLPLEILFDDSMPGQASSVIYQPENITNLLLLPYDQGEPHMFVRFLEAYERLIKTDDYPSRLYCSVSVEGWFTFDSDAEFHGNMPRHAFNGWNPKDHILFTKK